MASDGRKLPIGKRLAKSFGSCAIIRLLSRFASFVYRAVGNSIFAKIMTSYDGISEYARDSAVGCGVHGLGSAESDGFRRFKHGFSALTERSVLLSLLRKASDAMLVAPMSAYGIFFFSFGFYVSAIFILKRYAFAFASAELTTLIVGIVSIVISIAFFLSKKSLAKTVSESKILRFILFDLLCLRSEGLDSAAALPVKPGANASFIIGMAAGLLSIIVNPAIIAVVLASVLALSAVIASPEAGVIFICLALPFLPTMALAALMCLILFSCLIKFLCGKRVIKISLIDIPVMFFTVLTVFGGIFSKSPESRNKMLLMVCFMLAYFVVKNLIRSTSLLRKALGCIAFSGAIVSLYGIFENFIGSPSDIWQDTAAFGEIKGRVVSTFANPNVLGEFLILVIPITVALAITAGSTKERFSLSCAAAFDMFCLVLTWSRGAWLGFLLSAVLFLLLISRHFFTAGILLLPPATLALTIKNSSVLHRLTSIFTLSDTSSEYRIGIWRGTFRMLSDVFPYGIGIGEEAFASVYPIYALHGIETAPHSHNLYLQIATELGISGIAVFLLMLFVFMQMNFSYLTSAVIKKNRIVCIGIFCGLLAFLLAGMTDYVWYNYRIFLMFWIVFGLSAAEITMSKNTNGQSNDFFY